LQSAKNVSLNIKLANEQLEQVNLGATIAKDVSCNKDILYKSSKASSVVVTRSSADAEKPARRDLEGGKVSALVGRRPQYRIRKK